MSTHSLPCLSNSCRPSTNPSLELWIGFFLVNGKEETPQKKIRLLPEKPTDFSFKIGEGEVGILLSFQPILVIKFKFNNCMMILDFN